MHKRTSTASSASSAGESQHFTNQKTIFQMGSQAFKHLENMQKLQQKTLDNSISENQEVMKIINGGKKNKTIIAKNHNLLKKKAKESLRSQRASQAGIYGQKYCKENIILEPSHEKQNSCKLFFKDNTTEPSYNHSKILQQEDQKDQQSQRSVESGKYIQQRVNQIFVNLQQLNKGSHQPYFSQTSIENLKHLKNTQQSPEVSMSQIEKSVNMQDFTGLVTFVQSFDKRQQPSQKYPTLIKSQKNQMAANHAKHTASSSLYCTSSTVTDQVGHNYPSKGTFLTKFQNLEGKEQEYLQRKSVDDVIMETYISQSRQKNQSNNIHKNSTLSKESLSQYFPGEKSTMQNETKRNNRSLDKKEAGTAKKSAAKGTHQQKKSIQNIQKIFSNEKIQRKNSEILFQNLSPYQAIVNTAQSNKQTQRSSKLVQEQLKMSQNRKKKESITLIQKNVSNHKKHKNSSLIRVKELQQPNFGSFLFEPSQTRERRAKQNLHVKVQNAILSTSIEKQSNTLNQVSPKFGQSVKNSINNHDSLMFTATNPSNATLKPTNRFTLSNINQSIKNSVSPAGSRNIQTVLNQKANKLCTSQNIIVENFNNLDTIQSQRNTLSFNQNLTQIINAQSNLNANQVPIVGVTLNGYQLNMRRQSGRNSNGFKSYSKNNSFNERSLSQFKSERNSMAVTDHKQKQKTLQKTTTDDHDPEDSNTEHHKSQLQKCLSACKSPAQFKKQLHYNQPKLIKRDKSYTIKILFHTVRFLSVDSLIRLAQTSKKFSKIKEVKFIINSQFRTLVIKGLSTLDRAKYWNYRTRFVYYRRKYNRLYQKIITEKQSDYQSDIQKDLDRTFPQLKHFTKGNLGQDQLERLLTAISIYYKKLGYVQGMNFIVGTVMLNFQSEEDAFWMIISMLVNFKLDQLLTFENNKFKLLCYQIDMFVKAYLPTLYDVFKENELSSEFYASQWLLTLFSIDLPVEIVFIVIDLFLLEGYSALIRICLTLLKLKESEIFEMSYDESLVFLKTFGRYLETDLEQFFAIAMSFKISKQMLKDLEIFQQQEKGPYEVQFDHENKKWVIVTEPENLKLIMSQNEDEQYRNTLGNINDKHIGTRISKLDSKRDDSASNERKQKFNPMNAIGSLFKWFKKGKEEILIDDDNFDNHSDEVVSSRDASPAADRSGDYAHDKIASPSSSIITPQSQIIKTIKDSERSESQLGGVVDFSNYVNHTEVINESMVMNDIKESPRLNLPNLNWVNQYSHKTKEKYIMAEVEERIARIKNHKGVKGLLIVDENGKFLRSTMSTSGNDTAPKQYAQKVTELAKKARSVVRDIDPLNDLTFFRVRSKRQEIMVAPDKNLFLIVIQQPFDENE